MADSSVSLRKEGNISDITIDDGKANVFGLPMTSALLEALNEADVEEGAVRIVNTIHNPKGDRPKWVDQS